MEETDIDGFNLSNVITPGTFVEVVEHVVPELQRRGIYKTAYADGTLREKLFGRGPRLPDTHPAARQRGAEAPRAPDPALLPSAGLAEPPAPSACQRSGRCIARSAWPRGTGGSGVVPGARSASRTKVT